MSAIFSKNEKKWIYEKKIIIWIAFIHASIKMLLGPYVRSPFQKIKIILKVTNLLQDSKIKTISTILFSQMSLLICCLFLKRFGFNITHNNLFEVEQFQHNIHLPLVRINVWKKSTTSIGWHLATSSLCQLRIFSILSYQRNIFWQLRFLLIALFCSELRQASSWNYFDK